LFRIESNTEVTIRFEISNIRTALVSSLRDSNQSCHCYCTVVCSSSCRFTIAYI